MADDFEELLQLFAEMADNAGALTNPSEWQNVFGLTDEQAAIAQGFSERITCQDGLWVLGERHD